MVKVGIISIGDELLNGFTVDTNSSYIAKEICSYDNCSDNTCYDCRKYQKVMTRLYNDSTEGTFNKRHFTQSKKNGMSRIRCFFFESKNHKLIL